MTEAKADETGAPFLPGGQRCPAGAQGFPLGLLCRALSSVGGGFVVGLSFGTLAGVGGAVLGAALLLWSERQTRRPV